MQPQDSSNLYFQKLEEFNSFNKEFLANPIIKNFLNNKQNFQLFLDAICNPTGENMETVDQTFKVFYFNIRFTAFISSCLYFNAVNFDKKQRLYCSRYSLTVDRTVKNEEEITFKDIIEDPDAEIIIEKLDLSEDIANYITNRVRPNLRVTQRRKIIKWHI